MPLSITSTFAFSTAAPTDCLLQFEVAEYAGQRIISAATEFSSLTGVSRLNAEDGIGERVWLRADGPVTASHTAQVEITRPAPVWDRLSAVPPHALPEDAVKYLFDSRYCPAGRFGGYVDEEFPDSAAPEQGGIRIDAIRRWIAEHFTYTPGASGPETTGADSFIDRAGVCRDYAHVLVMLARASAIPARYVSCYGPAVTPQDFHAVAEVYLADSSGAEGGCGAWHLVDATGMATARDIAVIGVGRDAADVSFLTSFGPSDFQSSAVDVQRV
ncbi:transglutaminase family protein [Altererythrobacter sp. RZ02]|uniref:Transglutaminase family protein n=1 Tax=Pontixanthobacter rizhaonensis TaxID=2730337 RepID=A0A848QM80_9SPHN|nr:transglutaminase family protein [Pontixanthobacter rizhaonensis]NMW30656.1 transglutaminase family protein [Pontixanthobacter rizhaonensis]